MYTFVYEKYIPVKYNFLDKKHIFSYNKYTKKVFFNKNVILFRLLKTVFIKQAVQMAMCFLLNMNNFEDKFSVFCVLFVEMLFSFKN